MVVVAVPLTLGSTSSSVAFASREPSTSVMARLGVMVVVASAVVVVVVASAVVVVASAVMVVVSSAVVTVVVDAAFGAKKLPRARVGTGAGSW